MNALISDTELDLQRGNGKKTRRDRRAEIHYMKQRDIRFLKFLPLRGPSLWTYRPVLEVWVDIGELEDFPSNTLPGFVERLCEWLPTLSEHRCSYGEAGGFIKRLQEGTWPAHILEHVTLELQNLAGIPGGFGRARETSERGIYKVAVSAPHEDATRACLEAARELVMAAIEDTPFDVAATLKRLEETARKYLLGPSTACIVNAATAKERGIPAIRLSSDNLVQLGYGARQRRIWAAETDRTGAIGEGISRDSELTCRLLSSCGLPAVDPEDKDTVLTGKPHRLLVVGGTMVAATRTDAENEIIDVTDSVHPATAAAACLAARVVGLDIAGVNVMAEDLSQPLSSGNGAITAVHAGPDLTQHLQPNVGEARPVGSAIVDHLFPNGDTARIPVVGISGSSGNTEIARLVAEFLRLGGKYTGLACGDGLFLDRRLIESGDRGDWESGTRILMNRSVDAAVMENSADVILSQGLAYDRCQVGIVSRIDPASHYGRYHITQPEQVFQVLRSQVDVVLQEGVTVLNAADPMVVEMAPLSDGEVMFFASDPTLDVIEEHRAHGGRAVFIRENVIILATGDEETPLAPLHSIAFLGGTPSAMRVENVLAAIAAAWALGIASHVMRTGLETFSPEPAV